MKKLLITFAALMVIAYASHSFASPNINHHNNSVTGDVKSNIHSSNKNSNANKNANYNGNKNSNKNSNSNNNKASNYSNNEASASNFNHSSTNSDSKSKANSQAKSNSGAYNGGNSVNVEGDDYDLPANSVPVSIGGICTDAAAAQGNSLGVSISRSNPVCEKLKMMEVYKSLGMQKEANEALKDAEALSDVRGFFRGFLTVITLGIL